jgi:conjugal transfer ATP-binding protein TraC
MKNARSNLEAGLHAALKAPLVCETNPYLSLGKNLIQFQFSLTGLDASFFEESQWGGVQRTFQSFTRVSEGESVHFYFRKHSTLDRDIQQLLKEAELTVSPIRRRLLWEQVSWLISEAEQKSSLFEIVILSTVFLEKRGGEDQATFLRRGESTRLEWQQRFERATVSPIPQKYEEMIQNSSKSVQPSHYLPRPKVVDWPEVSIDRKDLQVGGEHVRVVTLEDLPEQMSWAGMLQHLTLSKFPFEMSCRLTGTDSKVMRRKLERKRRVQHGLISNKSAGDPQIESDFRQLDELLRRLSDSNDGLVKMNFTLAVRGSQEFVGEAVYELLAKSADLDNAKLSESSLNRFDCFLDLLPGFEGVTYHSQTLLSSNAAHFLPLFSYSRGEEDGVIAFPTRQGSLYHLNPVSDQTGNHNWVISGSSGSGKSYFTNCILQQMLRMDSKVWIVDVGGSYNKFVEFHGGRIVAPDLDLGFSFCPFPDPRSFVDTHDRQRSVEKATTILSEMCRDNEHLPGVYERSLLHKAVDQILSQPQLPPHPISEVRTLVESSNTPEGNKLSLLLSRFCKEQFFGSFLDNDNVLTITDPMVVFDLKGLEQFEELSRIVQMVICSAIWDSLKKRDRFTFIVLDEVAFTLLKLHPGFVDELVSTVRKHNCGVATIVQGLDKLTMSGMAGASILNNASRKVILQQRGDSKYWKEPLSLTDTDIQWIEALERKKGHYSDAFLMEEERKAVLRIQTTPLLHWLSTSDPKDNLELFKDYDPKVTRFADHVLRFVEEKSK